jgi:hypothetical protein
MQRFPGELHFRSLSFVIARVSRIGGGLLPATHGISSLHAAQVAILCHCRLLFCRRYPGEGFVAYVDYQSRPLDVEVHDQSLQARCYALSALVAVFDLHLRLLVQIITAWRLLVDFVESATICEKSLGIETACVVVASSPANRKCRSLTQRG